MKAPRPTASAGSHFCRALRLRCPACGISPIFISWKKVRSLRDWFAPLDGCPRCGYPYEREPGYYLMSIWAINYGVGSVLGLAIYGFLEWKLDLPVWQLLTAVLVPVFLFQSALCATLEGPLPGAGPLLRSPRERGWRRWRKRSSQADAAPGRGAFAETGRLLRSSEGGAIRLAHHASPLPSCFVGSLLRSCSRRGAGSVGQAGRSIGCSWFRSQIQGFATRREGQRKGGQIAGRIARLHR